MANLEDLDYKSILGMSHDESLEHIRQARLRRRVEKKPQTKSKTSAKKPIFDLSTLSEEDKKELLELLEEE